MTTQPKPNNSSLGLKVWGPLLSWSVMFIISIAIKVIAFGNNAVWFEIAPEATLWATGVLFTIAVADDTLSQARLLPKYKKKQSGSGFEVDYDITLPDSYDPSERSKYFYAFLIALGAWIINIFLSGLAIANAFSTSSAQQANINPTVVILFFISIFIAMTIVIFAIRLLQEASK